MNEDEIKLNQNIHRVCLNLLVLLDVGLFPGKHSLALTECQGFVKNLADDTAAKMEPKVVPPIHPLVGLNTPEA